MDSPPRVYLSWILTLFYSSALNKEDAGEAVHVLTEMHKERSRVVFPRPSVATCSYQYNYEADVQILDWQIDLLITVRK